LVVNYFGSASLQENSPNGGAARKGNEEGLKRERERERERRGTCPTLYRRRGSNS
jgi:hypothetical protein